MRRMTTWNQFESMRKAWPGFVILHRTRCHVTWVGRLRPFCQTYTILLVYRFMPDRRHDAWSMPCVMVIEPPLHRREEDPEEPIPHHYPNPEHPEFPFLCLYDPDAREWSSGRLLSKTIIPWTIEWLACYEGWLATGEWTGGGRHPCAG